MIQRREILKSTDSPAARAKISRMVRAAKRQRHIQKYGFLIMPKDPNGMPMPMYCSPNPNGKKKSKY